MQANLKHGDPDPVQSCARMKDPGVDLGKYGVGLEKLRRLSGDMEYEFQTVATTTLVMFKKMEEVVVKWEPGSNLEVSIRSTKSEVPNPIKLG